MKNTLLTLIVCLAILGCKNEKKEINKNETNYEEVVKKESDKINILQHPLIFEDLGIKIVEFSSEEINKNEFLIKIVVEENNVSKYNENHFFYIHGIEYESVENDVSINMDTKDGVLENGKIIFTRLYKKDIYDFKELRFGLVNRIEKTRYFTRTLMDVSLKR